MLGDDPSATVLGIPGEVRTDPEEMADQLRVTRFPLDEMDASERERRFAKRLMDAFEEAGVEVVDYEQTLEPLDLGTAATWVKRSLKRAAMAPVRALTGNGDGSASFEEAKRPPLSALLDVRLGDRIEPGTTVVAVGEGDEGELPVDRMGEFKDVTIVTVADAPDHVDEEMPFTDHYETALEMFAHYMTNVVVGVDEDEWFLYNFNGSHPFYDRDVDLTEEVRTSLVPKLAAPIRPPKLEGFDVREEAFDPTDDLHAPIVEEMVDSANVLDESGLYPEGKDLDELPWRNDFYRWAGKIHLDDRTGMSYGFLARQLPTEVPRARPPEDARGRLGRAPPAAGTVDQIDGDLVATLDTPRGPRVLRVPPVEVMTLRSGCDKTDPDPEQDLVKLGLEAGQMVMSTPVGTRVEEGYRPSFDTKVILAHAVGNALVAGLVAADDDTTDFADHLADEGMALAHWHGYPNPEHLPDGWHVHGADRPPVSCGTPHAGLFALQGKLEAYARAVEAGEPFLGDAHLEPQHGTNLTHRTLEHVGAFLTREEDVAGLGNRFLDAYRASERARAPA
jgi:hypothetical protein